LPGIRLLTLRKLMRGHCLAADGMSARVLPQAAVPAAAKRAALIL